MKNNQIIKKFSYVFVLLLAAFALNSFANAQEKAATATQGKDKQKPWETDLKGWRTSDYKPYIQAMKDISKLSQEYSEIVLKLAIDEYSSGIDKLEDMEVQINKIEETNKNKKNLNEKWYWQEVDRRNQEKRQVGMIKQEAKMKAITYFVMAINHLDDVQARAVLETPEFTNFKSRLYQVFVSTQYDLQNYLPCIPILERYILLNNETRKDVWAYKYLTNCYAFMENVLSKSRHTSEEKVMHYRQLKNKYLLQASEMQYGIESVEYKQIQEIVSRDEKKTERLNDFR